MLNKSNNRISAFELCESRVLLAASPLPATATAAPKVAAVYVSSTNWSQSFKNQLASAGKGSSSYGYAIPTGAQQNNDVPWQGLNQVSITFNQPVVVQKDDLIIRGVNTAEYSTGAFNYDAASKTATWTLASGSSFRNDRLLLELDGNGYQSIYDSGGFEAPRFVPSDVEGNGVPAGQGSWQQTGTTGQGIVENSLAADGSQAVSITRAGADERWGVHETVTAPSAPVSIAWDMYVKKTTFPLPGSFGPYMGVEAYDDLGNPPLLAGSAGVDASTGEVLYQAAGSGYIVSTGQTLPFDSWHHFNMVLNYATHSYSVYVDGNALVSNIGFVDAGVNDFSDAPFAALAAGADTASQQASGQAYFDNYTIGINAPTGYQSVYNSGGFEYPLFVPGNLGGSGAALSTQDSWVRTGNPGTGVVENSLAADGTQAVSITRQGADERWAVRERVANPTAPVVIKWDMNVKQTIFAQPGSFGPYMAVEAYDDLGNPPRLAGSAGVDASTGEVLYQDAGTGYIVSTGQTVAFNTWHHFDMVLNYASHTYSVYLDGSPVASNIGFVDAGVDDFTDAPLAALAAGADPASQNASGQAFFDNYSIGLATTPVNSDGLALDGEWVNGVSSFPSGDGSAGGDFRFALNVLVGDISGNGSVDFADLVTVAQHYGQSSLFPAQGDLTGDGMTDFADLVAVAQNYGSSLPGFAAAAVPAALPLFNKGSTLTKPSAKVNASLFNSTQRIVKPASAKQPLLVTRH